MIVKNIIAIMSKQSFHLVRRNREGSIKNTLLLYCLQYAGKYETLEQPAYTIEETEKGHFLFWYTFLMPGEPRIVTISKSSFTMKELIEPGADGIFTNRPDLLKEVIQEMHVK